MSTIVVVDDESLVTDFLTFLLESNGHQVIAARNGKAALEIVPTASPALVITDLMMPMMSGLELVRALREMPDYVELPVLLVSAAPAALSSEERTLFADILAKPYPPDALMALVTTHLGGAVAPAT